MGQIIIPDPCPTSGEILPSIEGSTEPQPMVIDVVPLVVDQEQASCDATSSTVTVTQPGSEQSTSILVSTTPPKKTLRELIKGLVLKHALEQNDVDDETSDPNVVLYDKKTAWRLVFNTFIEPAGEEQKKSLRSERLRAVRTVEYPTGTRLGRGVGRSTDGIMWGETLADFYHVRPWSEPNCPQASNPTGVFVTTSMLYARFKSVTITRDDHFDQVRQIMQVAETERPRQILSVYAIESLIKDGEAWIASEFDASWVQPTRPGTDLEEKRRERWEVPESWPPKSVFDPSAYPSPWPLEPFKRHDWLPSESVKNFIHKPKLEVYIPEYLLPKTLIVHDPWEVLYGETCTARTSTSWHEKDVNTCVYRLDCGPHKTRYKQDCSEVMEEKEKEQKLTQMFFENPHSSMEKPKGVIYHSEPELLQQQCLGPAKPPVFIVYPPRPAKVAPEEAHLYLSPAERIGEGHHSLVYRAEFEVPRSLLVEDRMCKQCVYDDAKRILEEEDGPNGERRDPRWDEPSGNYVLQVESKPDRKVFLDSAEYVHHAGYVTTNVVYEGPYRLIQSRVGWQNLERAPYCEHLRETLIHPLTAKVEVAAKLSKMDDDQLDLEADNYKAFPKHFFQHQNGFNLCTTIHSQPAPCGALVPQYYGYYRPDLDDERNTVKEDERDGELSPILLLEECGRPIVPESLTADEQNECISLVLRMHEAGWVQNSLYSRNIVIQSGPLTHHPVIRRKNSFKKGPARQKSFRLIDFGRTGSEKELGRWEFAEDKSHEWDKLASWSRSKTLF